MATLNAQANREYDVSPFTTIPLVGLGVWFLLVIIH